MVDKLFGGKTAKEILFYIYSFNEGYATEISKFSGISLSIVQKQLIKFEDIGILVSNFKGKTKMYMWNPRCFYLDELKALLKKIFLTMNNEDRERYNTLRRRPRKSDNLL